jgi:hypothetical protein
LQVPGLGRAVICVSLYKDCATVRKPGILNAAVA